jgi:hypothetical protein
MDNKLSCKVAGCCKEANRKGAQLCEMHYVRLRRNGNYEKKARKDVMEHSHGYILQRKMDGSVDYQHRIVYVHAHGRGPFACHWCGKVSDFKKMHVDHLDDNKKNNGIDNLAATCPVCNQQRGREKLKATLRSKFGVEFRGEVKTWNEWADHVGMSRHALLARLAKGWPLERVLTHPRGPYGPRSKV